MEFQWGLHSEPEQRHREADSANGYKDKWKNVDAWETHRQREEDERESSPFRPLPHNGGTQVVFISSYTLNYSLQMPLTVNK